MRFTTKRQLTVALQNQPGRLAAISQLIAQHGLNIEGLCVVDNMEQGVVRLLIDDPARCKTVLEEAGLFVVEAEVLTISLADQRGKLALVTRALADAKLNIDYAYATVEHGSDGARSVIVLRVSSIRLAEEVLAKLANA